MDENIIDEQKSQEALDELKAQAEQELASATVIEYGNSEEDVNAVNGVKSKLDQMLDTLVKGKDEYFTNTNDNLAKFRELATYFQTSIDANAVTNTNLANLLKKELDSVKKTIDELEKSLTDYDKKVDIISKAITYLTFQVKEDGKCYVEQYAIDFAKLLLA